MSHPRSTRYFTNAAWPSASIMGMSLAVQVFREQQTFLQRCSISVTAGRAATLQPTRWRSRRARRIDKLCDHVLDRSSAEAAADVMATVPRMTDHAVAVVAMVFGGVSAVTAIIA